MGATCIISWRFTFSFVVVLLTVSTVAEAQSQQHGTKEIEELRNLLKGKIYPEYSQLHEHVKDDLYLTRWLGQSNYNVRQTYNNIMEHLRWRKSENIDKIDQDDWFGMQEEYPQFVDTTDKWGRPVSELWFSEWNVRRAVVTGQLPRLLRWWVRHCEMTQRNLYLQRKYTGNTNITGVVDIIDVEGYNNFKHGCALCMPLLTNIGRIDKFHYPDMWEKNYLVNAGPLFRQTFSTIKVGFDHGNSKIIKMFTGKSEWLPLFDKIIDKNQRSVRFGGSIKRN